MIYFIEGRHTGLIKVGFTEHDPKVRLRDLQTGSPDTLSLIGVVDGDQKLERELHDSFVLFWHHGEWFEPCYEIRTYLEDNNLLDAPYSPFLVRRTPHSHN